MVHLQMVSAIFPYWKTVPYVAVRATINKKHNLLHEHYPKSYTGEFTVDRNLHHAEL